MAKIPGADLPKEAMSQPPGAKKGDHDSKSMGDMKSRPGIPGEQGAKMAHEITNDKFSKKLVGC